MLSAGSPSEPAQPPIKVILIFLSWRVSENPIYLTPANQPTICTYEDTRRQFHDRHSPLSSTLTCHRAAATTWDGITGPLRGTMSLDIEQQVMLSDPTREVINLGCSGRWVCPKRPLA